MTGVAAHYTPAHVTRSLSCNTVVLAANEVNAVGAHDDGGGCSPHMWHGCCAHSLSYYTVILAATRLTR